jgi:zinc transporter 1/2/3
LDFKLDWFERLVDHFTKQPSFHKMEYSNSLSASGLLLTLFFTVLSTMTVGVQADAAGQGNSESCESTVFEAYTLTWHIAGVFIVFAVSALGIFGTMLLGIRLQYPMVENTLQLFKVFGIGVVASTVWIHLLPDSFSQFSSPCLTGVWASYGINWVGVFALISTFALQLVENGLGLHDEFNGHTHCHLFPAEIVSDKPNSERQDPPSEDVQVEVDHMNGLAVPPSSEEDENSIAMKPDTIDTGAVSKKHGIQKSSGQKLLMITILELGILIHSVVIGLSLGVSTGDTYTTLLIAICFHQLFEGMALGALIGATSAGLLKKAVMCLFYPLTTPLGMAIGIAVRESYNENSTGLILFQGITGSLSSGILMYNTYCNLLGEEINQNGEFLGFKTGWKVANYGMLYLGAASMAVIGNWA